MLQPSDKAPDFELPLLTGGLWRLSDALQKGSVLLVFFKISCETCHLTFPYLQRLVDAGQSGAPQLLAVSQDNAEDTQYFHDEFKTSMPTLLEDPATWNVSNSYGIANVPTFFLIGADGVIERSFEGFFRPDLESLAELFGVNLFGPGDSVPLLKPGCMSKN